MIVFNTRTYQRRPEKNACMKKSFAVEYYCTTITKQENLQCGVQQAYPPGIRTLLKSIRRRNMASHYKGAACARSVPRTLQNSNLDAYLK